MSSVLGPSSNMKLGGSNMTFVEREKDSLSLPKITKTTKKLANMRGNNVMEYKIIDRKPGMNIFSGKDE
jgi:hypothetical protein